MGKMSEAIALLRKVVALRPDLAATHLDLALALADSYDLPGALAETNEAVRLAPQSGVVHFYRGRVLYDLGRTTEAQPEFETACRLVPQMPEPRYFLALIDKQEGKFPLAAGLLEETVQLEPRNVMAWYLLGQSLYQQHPRPRKQSQPGGRPSLSIPTSARRSSAWPVLCDLPIAPNPTSSWRAMSRSKNSGASWTAQAPWPITALLRPPLTTGPKPPAS